MSEPTKTKIPRHDTVRRFDEGGGYMTLIYEYKGKEVYRVHRIKHIMTKYDQPEVPK